MSIFAGCVAPSFVSTPTATTSVPALPVPTFSTPKILDTVRAGGEPVIAITHTGTILVSSHPGWTHYHGTAPPAPPALPTDLLEPASGQSYLWRSTDNGTTWRPIGLPIPQARGMGPRSAGLGVSDPDFTVMADGTVCMTDLEGLAESSVSCSTDDGLTWTGNPIASQFPNDRPWLASYGKELYFKTDYAAGYQGSVLIASTDHGLTWTKRGDTGCQGAIVANPRTGAIYAGCGDGVAASTDHGLTFKHQSASKVSTTRTMTEPGIDSANNIWYPIGLTGEKTLYVIGSPDNGTTWPWMVNLTSAVLSYVQNDTGGKTMDFVWPWISAGSTGRFAVTWIGASSDQTSPSVSASTPWYAYTAFVVNATSARPQIEVVRDTPQPIHDGPICEGGTGCQVTSVQGNPSGDRRLGDFFETTIDQMGLLHVVVADTQANPNDDISHPLYFAETAGPRLVAPGDPMPTQ